MKNTIVCLFLLFLFGTAQAQDQKLRFGLYGEPNISWMKPMTGDIESQGAQMGWVYGLIIDNHFAEKYAFSTGIEIVHNGGSIRYTDSTFSIQGMGANSDFVDVAYQLQYVQVPLTLKLKTAEYGFMTYFGQVGFTPGLRINSLGSITSSNPLDVSDDKVKLTGDEVALFNLALTISGGVEYSLGGSTALLLQGQFKNGFVNVTKNDDEVRLNYIGIRLGILF